MKEKTYPLSASLRVLAPMRQHCKAALKETSSLRAKRSNLIPGFFPPSKLADPPICLGGRSLRPLAMTRCGMNAYEKTEFLLGPAGFKVLAGFLLLAGLNGTLYADAPPAVSETKKVTVPGNPPAAPLAKAPAQNRAVRPVSAMGGPSKKGAASPGKVSVKKELKPEDKEYVLQKGDKIKITIYPEDTVIKGAAMEISSEGNITLPLVGKVEVAEKSAIEAQHAIAEILERDYLVNPEVVIEVAEKFATEKDKAVVLLGQVKSPGSHPFPKNGRFTLLQAIAVAGGFSDVANIKKIKIIRGGAEKGKVIRANADSIISGTTPDIELEDGDIINVAESIF